MVFKLGEKNYWLGKKRIGFIPHNKKIRNKIICACGCNKELIDVSDDGRNRKFIHGHNKPWLGKKRDTETIEKMRQSRIGKKDSEETKKRKSGRIPWNKGLKGFMAGEINVNWKGGITPLKRRIRELFKNRQWRSDVFTRDDFTCQKCGEKGGFLHADHIKPFSLIIDENNIQTIEEAIDCEELWNINNGQTLCRDCHNKKHGLTKINIKLNKNGKRFNHTNSGGKSKRDIYR